MFSCKPLRISDRQPQPPLTTYFWSSSSFEGEETIFLFMFKINRISKLSFTVTLMLITMAGLPFNVNNHRHDRAVAQTVANSQSLNYQQYQQVLKTYVKGIRVDYRSLQSNRGTLDRFNKSLGNVSQATYNSWNDKEKIAFLINAYNSFTLESIIDQKPIKASIRDIPGVWKRRKFKVAGQQKTLDNIEHDILRKDFNEPRLHMALVCAAKSCPPLRKEAYTGQKLDSQLDDQTRQFLKSPHGFKIDRQKKRVYLSSIFKWFGEDWLQTYRVNGNQFAGNAKQKAVLNFVSQYLNEADRNFLIQGDYKISYLRYDWSLNGN